MPRPPALAAVLTLALASRAAAAGPPLVVHEWGTFTSLHDEMGRTIAGINTEDEPLPAFAHDLARLLLLPRHPLPPVFFQGAPHCHPDVTLRLETPVIYFHPPSASPIRAHVRAALRGGWLTQYYPDAEATGQAPDQSQPGRWSMGRLTTDTLGGLAWQHLTIGSGRPGPATDQRVWLAPRRVKAADVTTPRGESERFLFYRGVGHLDAPIAVVRSGDGATFELRAQLGPALASAAPLPIRHLWLADIRDDQAVAFRPLDPLAITATPGELLALIPNAFPAGDYSLANLTTLREAMHRGLVEDGLFADEATALLDTWEVSYFRSAGLRLFFLLPRPWTDHYLPLTISVPATVHRSMVGRIELVTPGQRALLSTIAAGPASNGGWREQLDRRGPDGTWLDATWRRIENGKESLLSLGDALPGHYRAYVQLGRFRNALLLDEQRRRPGTAIDAFVENYGLQGYDLGPRK